MSSKRRSYDTDEITLRKVFAKSFLNNSAIPAQRVLTADGAGGTYWAIPSTLGLNPSFNQINTSAGNFTADLSYNIFTLTAQSGIGFSRGAGSNELNIFGKAFNQIDVSGNNSLYGFTSNLVTPTLKLAGTGGISLLSDPDTNTVTITAQGTQVSTSLFSFQKVQVYRNASTIRDNLDITNSVILNAASPSSTLKYVGLSEILLSTNTTNNLIFYSLNPSTGTISTILGTYVRKTDFSTATTALASTSLGYYNILSTITINGLSTLSTGIGNATVNLSTFNLSTTNIFTSTINFNDITNGTLNTLAVSTGILVLNGQGIVGTVEVTKNNLVSTVTGLGTAGYISTFSTNQLSTGLLQAGNLSISTATFKDSGNANLYSLFSSNASLYFNDTLVGAGTVINNTNICTTIYQVSSVSSLYAFATNINISTVTNAFLSPDFFSSIFFSTGNVNVSSVSLKDRTTNNLQYLTADNGVLKFNTSNIVTDSNLNSTVIGLGSAGYISSATLVSTVRGLGSAGYISSLQLGSTVVGLANAGFVSTGQLVSSIVGLGTYGYISSLTLISSVEQGLVSTVIGLGNAGYISSLTLISSVEQGLVSTVIGLGSYLSTGWLQAGNVEISTLNFKDQQDGSLYSLYSSNATLIFNGSSVSGDVRSNELTSTVIGLGSSGYISSTQLTSTMAGLGKIAVTKIVAGTNVSISPTTGIGEVTINSSGGGGGGSSAFSTVLISTISTLINPTTVQLQYLSFSTFTSTFASGSSFTFSSGSHYSQMSSVHFKIDTFSSYITSSANIFVGVQYNYRFSAWGAPFYLNIEGPPFTGSSFASFIKPYVNFSTTLKLGETPGNYIHDFLVPNTVQTVYFAFVSGNGLPYNEYTIPASNSMTRNNMFEIPKTSFENLYKSTFSLYHVLDFGLLSLGSSNYVQELLPSSSHIFSGTSGFSNSDVQVSIGSNNPITIYITN